MEFEENNIGLSDYLAIIKRRKKAIIIPALLILLIAVGLAFGLPSIYRSEATILIEQQEIPPELVRSTVTSYAGERIQIISQRVMTTENLGKIIDDYGLFQKEQEKNSLTSLIEGMREDISLEMISADVVDPRSGRPTTATIAFKLAFSHKDPRVAQKVTNELLSLYLNENLKQRTQSAVETSSFLDVESEKLKEEVQGLETLLATFKEKNINALPELQQLNMQLMERSERDLKDIQQQMRNLDERAIYLQSELAQMNPTSSMYATDGKRILSAEDRLSTLQSEYIGLSSRYSATHPDLIKMSREIEALKKETGVTEDINELQRHLTELHAEKTALNERYSDQHPDVKKLLRLINTTQAALDKAVRENKAQKVMTVAAQPDNPAYIQLQAQLNAAEVELSSLKRAEMEVKTKITEFEQRLLASPQVERQYRDLTRDYENALAKYREVRAKQQQAELATSLERENKGERFSLIEPPLVPEKPAQPNRMAILFLGFVFSMAGGVGTAAIAEALNTAIKSPQELVNITRAPPLIVVPYIETAGELGNTKTWKRIIVAVILLGGIAALTLFHFFYMPLDVLWYLIIRKLGLEESMAGLGLG